MGINMEAALVKKGRSVKAKSRKVKAERYLTCSFISKFNELLEKVLCIQHIIHN
jgi:hypothetical protein